MKKLLILKSLPGAGKSTWAKTFLESEPTYIRVNRDDIRNMLGREFSSKFEKLVTQVEHQAILGGLEKGYNVIVDDTNLNPKTVEALKNLVKDIPDLQIEEKFFDVSPEECIKRDSERTGKAKVGPAVIWGMYNRYLKKDVDSNT